MRESHQLENSLYGRVAQTMVEQGETHPLPLVRVQPRQDRKFLVVNYVVESAHYRWHPETK